MFSADLGGGNTYYCYPVEYAVTNGVYIIEATERTGKAFAVERQFRQETAAVKHFDKAAD